MRAGFVSFFKEVHTGQISATALGDHSFKEVRSGLLSALTSSIQLVADAVLYGPTVHLAADARLFDTKS